MKQLVAKIFIAGCIFLGAPFFVYAANVGETEPFYVDSSYDAYGRNALMASLVEISDRAYFYAEDQWWSKLELKDDAKMAIHNLAMEFDQKIYPALTQNYGSFWEPGIDNDNRVVILISRIQGGAGGYFNSADEYPRTQSLHSNEREMIYLNALYLDSPRAKSFIAHEFQHLITFYQKEKLRGVSEEIWLNEARSEFASTLVGYDDNLAGSNLEKRISDFYKNPSDSLTEWGNETSDYGVADLFMQYFVNHFGKNILARMVQSPEVGVASINAALKFMAYNENFADVFMNWTVANYLNDCRVSGQKYCYINSELSSRIKAPTTIYQNILTLGPSETSWSDSIKDWAGHWYQFSGGTNNLQINFKAGQGTNFKVAYIIEYMNGINEVKLVESDGSVSKNIFVSNLGKDVKTVTLVPVSETKNFGFGASEESHAFSYEASLTSENLNLRSPDTSIYSSSSVSSVILPSYPEGSLIRARGDYKVYVISGGYKRWIQNQTIFGFYRHFKWQEVQEVIPEEISAYKETGLVREVADKKVYETNADATKHWLNMTANEFAASGRKWDSIFIINKAERDFYKAGADVYFK